MNVRAATDWLQNTLYLSSIPDVFLPDQYAYPGLKDVVIMLQLPYKAFETWTETGDGTQVTGIVREALQRFHNMDPDTVLPVPESFKAHWARKNKFSSPRYRVSMETCTIPGFRVSDVNPTPAASSS